jgi:hypothetical protein
LRVQEEGQEEEHLAHDNDTGDASEAEAHSRVATALRNAARSLGRLFRRGRRAGS